MLIFSLPFRAVWEWGGRSYGWGPQKVKGRYSPFHRIESALRPFLKAVIILMSSGACQDKWSGCLELWYVDNWPCQALSKPQAGQNDTLRVSAANLALDFSDVYDYRHLLPLGAKKKGIELELGIKGRFWVIIQYPPSKILDNSEQESGKHTTDNNSPIY